MKFLIIKKNHGNHIGHQVKWELEDQYDTLEEAKKSLDTLALNHLVYYGNYSYNEEGIYAKDDYFLENCEYLFGCEIQFYDGLEAWYIISEKDFDTFFDGHAYGYKPQFIKELQSI